MRPSASSAWAQARPQTPRIRFPIAVYSHRGGPLEGFEENTLPAFRNSARLGVDLLELDVQMTRDGQVVVFHDRCVGQGGAGRYRLGVILLELDVQMTRDGQVVVFHDRYRSEGGAGRCVGQGEGADDARWAGAGEGDGQVLLFHDRYGLGGTELRSEGTEAEGDRADESRSIRRGEEWHSSLAYYCLENGKRDDKMDAGHIATVWLPAPAVCAHTCSLMSYAGSIPAAGSSVVYLGRLIEARGWPICSTTSCLPSLPA